MNQYTEKDVGQAAFAAYIHDNTHEGKSIVDLAEERNFIPPLLERIIPAKSIELANPTIEDIERDIERASKSRVHDMLLKLDHTKSEMKILKGAVDMMVDLAGPTVNQAEINW